jgi:D-serine dehydratase
MSNEAVEVEDISLTNPELQQPKKKAKKKSPPKAKPPPDTEESGRILEREWVKVREAREGALRVKIMTWNVSSSYFFAYYGF